MVSSNIIWISHPGVHPIVPRSCYRILWRRSPRCFQDLYKFKGRVLPKEDVVSLIRPVHEFRQESVSLETAWLGLSIIMSSVEFMREILYYEPQYTSLDVDSLTWSILRLFIRGSSAGKSRKWWSNTRSTSFLLVGQLNIPTSFLMELR